MGEVGRKEGRKEAASQFGFDFGRWIYLGGMKWMNGMDGRFDRFGSCLVNKYESIQIIQNPKQGTKENKETNACTNRETDRQTRFQEMVGSKGV